MKKYLRANNTRGKTKKHLENEKHFQLSEPSSPGQFPPPALFSLCPSLPPRTATPLSLPPSFALSFLTPTSLLVPFSPARSTQELPISPVLGSISPRWLLFGHKDSRSPPVSWFDLSGRFDCITRKKEIISLFTSGLLFPSDLIVPCSAATSTSWITEIFPIPIVS